MDGICGETTWVDDGVFFVKAAKKNTWKKVSSSSTLLDKTDEKVTDTHDGAEAFSVLTPAENKWWHTYAPVDEEFALQEAWAE